MGNIFSKKDHVQLIEEPEEDNKKQKISLQNLKIEDDKQIIQDKEQEQFNSENKQDDQAIKKLKDPYLLQYETIFYNFEKIGQDFKHQNIDDIIVYQNKSEIDYNLTYKEIIRPQYPIEEIYQSMEDWHPNIIQIQASKEDSWRSIFLCKYRKQDIFFDDIQNDLDQLLEQDLETLSNRNMWYIIDSIIGAMAFLQNKQIIHGQIKFSNIFNVKNPQKIRVYKISNPYLHLKENSNYEKAQYYNKYKNEDDNIFKLRHLFLSPEQLLSMQKNVKYNDLKQLINLIKSDVFTVGMLFLYLYSYQFNKSQEQISIYEIYDWNKLQIDQEKLDIYLDQLFKYKNIKRFYYKEDHEKNDEKILSNFIVSLINIDPSKRPDFMELDKQLDQILKTSRVKNFLNNKCSRLIMSREQAEQNIKEIVKIQTEKIYYQYEKEIIKLKSTKQKKMSKKELQELQEQQEIMQLELEGKEVLNEYDYKLMGQQLIFSEMQKLQKTQMLQMKIQQEQIQNQELMNEQYQIHINSNSQHNEKQENDQNNEKEVIKFDFLDMKLENEVIKSEDGEIYEGQTYKGVRNGNGKQTYKDGTYYIGEFIDDKKSGKGKLFNKEDQIIYEGLFYDDKYNGQGLLQNQNVQFLKNSEQFNYNFFSKLQNKWEKYEGEFKQGIQEGFGILFISNNSEKFVGNFTKGIPNGYGTYYQNNGNKVNGYWENGKLTKVL